MELASGDVRRDLPLPLHLALPRHFCCARARGAGPGGRDRRVAVRFAVNISVVFEDDTVVTESVPIKIYRN